MQIFSKLQRNSTYYVIVTVVLLILALFNSTYIFFPLLLGFVFLCLGFFEAIIYTAFFSVLHRYNIFYFEFFYLSYVFYVKNKILELFNKEYFDVISLCFIYLGYFIYLSFFADFINFVFIYIIYNFAFDLLIIRLFKCKAE